MNELLSKARRLSRVLQVPLWRKAFWTHRVGASVEHEVVVKTLYSLDLIVDIGANRGQFSLLARHFFPSATIFSFEPLASPSAIYRNIFADDQQVRHFRVAIGPCKSEEQIHISARDCCSSLLPISELQVKTFSGTGEVGTMSVLVAPLSDFLQPEDVVNASLLKIDVQGYECHALRGCEGLLHRFAYVYCECSFVELYSGQYLAPDIARWLAARGFVIKGIYNVHYDPGGTAIQADFLFHREMSFP